MTSQKHLNHVLEKYELEMQQLEHDETYTLMVNKKIQNTMDSTLKNLNYSSFFDLLPYFEEPEAHPQFHLSTDTYRVHILLNILKLEMKYQKHYFVSGISSYSDFLKRYDQVVFSLRRLELTLSTESVDEATQFLTSIPFSIYAGKIIAENEYFENFEKLYWNVYFTMETIWSIEDKIMWLNFLLQKATTPNLLMEIASLYMDIGNYRQAYDTLINIPNPSIEITQLINSLKELL